MSEQLNTTGASRAELRFDAVNHTADALIVDRAANKIVLIKRGDCGEWALPGGFVDADELPCDAARREACEEAAIELTGTGNFVYHGIVDDPRNTERSWIETSAYLFDTSCESAVNGGDDANDAAWFELNNLPPLYASHDAIIARTKDYLAAQERTVFESECRTYKVDGGHMGYEKKIIQTTEQALFIKSHDPTRFTNAEKSEHAMAYLRKEAATMSHLRTVGFTHLPAFSIIHMDTTLVMEGFERNDGWRWRLPENETDTYITDCLAAFTELEMQPLPPDSSEVNATLGSMLEEGWQSINVDTLHQTVERLLPQLHPASRDTARQIVADASLLRRAMQQLPPIDDFVLCHHDIRQSNVAWHSDHGARLIDWSWADAGRPGSDATSFLIDLHKSEHDIAAYHDSIDRAHCLTLLGFWLGHASWPTPTDDQTIRVGQLASAISAYELLSELG